MLTLSSPAKINLFLRILGKRPDGYHELASLFQAIDLKDTLTFALAEEDRLTCSDPSLLCDQTNLILKAVNLFRQKSGLRFAIEIHVEKKIPMQAGLGGGSSNAATTLWALNALHNNPFSEQELQQWSSEIGSDIPFFFSEGTAYCTGRGELVRNLPALPQSQPFFIFTPAKGISTPDVFKELRLPECSKEDPEALLEGFYLGRPRFINDLEGPAFRILPALEQYKKSLIGQGYTCVTMSGSGSSFFGYNNLQFRTWKPMRRQPFNWYQLK